MTYHAYTAPHRASQLPRALGALRSEPAVTTHQRVPPQGDSLPALLADPLVAPSVADFASHPTSPSHDLRDAAAAQMAVSTAVRRGLASAVWSGWARARARVR